MRIIVPILLLTFAVGGCDSTPDGPVRLVACETYHPAAGHPQITCIYYDEVGNGAADGVRDEWVVIDASDTINTRGWAIVKGNNQAVFRLASSIPRRLIVYTHEHTAYAGLGHVQMLNLDRDAWLWSDSTADEARLVDDRGRVVHRFTYVGRKSE